MSVDERLRRVFHEVFDTDGIDDGASPATVTGWDSMGHLALVSELEHVFAVKFTTTEIVEMVNVRCIMEILGEHGVTE